MPVRSRAAVLKALKGPRYGAGWWSKAKSTFKKHAKKHINKAKKYGRRALAEGKKHAKAAAKMALEEAKREAKEMLQKTAEEAAQALHAHVSSTVCSAVGSGFAKTHGREMKKILHKEFDKIHVKALAHAKTGKAGGALNDHVDKATKRVEAGVDRLKNKAKSRIRELAGCDEGEGLQVRGAGLKRRKKRGGSVRSDKALKKLFANSPKVLRGGAAYRNPKGGRGQTPAQRRKRQLAHLDRLEKKYPNRYT